MDHGVYTAIHGSLSVFLQGLVLEKNNLRRLRDERQNMLIVS